MTSQAEYDAGTKAVAAAVEQAEKDLPFFVKQMISQAPASQVNAFYAMLAKAVVDAAAKVRSAQTPQGMVESGGVVGSKGSSTPK